MKLVEVEAVEDRTRAEGGHVVILLRGVEHAGAARFRLHLLHGEAADGPASDLFSRDLEPLGANETDEGLALVIGPQIAEAPVLVPGTAVEIVLPDVGVRGEFLWPAVTPQSRPKRRNIMIRHTAMETVKRAPSPVAAAVRRREDTAPAAWAAEAEALDEAPVRNTFETMARRPRVVAAATRLATVVPIEEARLAIAPAAVESAPAAPAPSPEPEVEVAQPIEVPQSTLTPAEAPLAELMPAAEPAPIVAPAAALPIADSAPVIEVPIVRSPAPAAAGATAIANSPREPEFKAPPAARPVLPVRPRFSVASAAVLAVAVAGIGQLVVLRALDMSITRRIPAAAAAATAPAAGVPRREAASSSAAVAAPASAATASAVAPATPAAPAAARRSIFDVIVAGPRSPRGMAADDVSPAKALQIAHALLHGPEQSRDAEEAIFWLKRYVAATSGAEHARIALTQLGSAYAAPVSGRQDLEGARMVWELAGALGDPVAMCFLGAMHERGLGVPVSDISAGIWYERAAAAGKSCVSGLPDSGTSRR